MTQPDDPSADRASVKEYDANRIELKTSSGAAGLLKCIVLLFRRLPNKL